MDGINLIVSRRAEVLQEIAELRDEQAKLEAELAELDTAGRVMARLSSKNWEVVISDEERASQVRQEQYRRVLGMKVPATMPEKIIEVLALAYNRGLAGLEPKEIAELIYERWPEADEKPAYIGSIVWRMWREKRLIKPNPDGALYALPPHTEKPASLLSLDEGQVAGSDQPARAGEPGREVGHDNIS